MDFLKKNWAKLTIAVLSFVVAVLYIIALITTDAKIKPFEETAASFAAVIFFLGLTAYYVCKMLDQKWAKYILVCTAVISMVFAIANIIHVADYWDTYYKAAYDFKVAGVPSMFEYLVGTHAFTFLVVFGLIPLVKGIKKIICCCCEGDKKEAPKAAPAAAAAKK